jgi:hypothetical protein
MFLICLFTAYALPSRNDYLITGSMRYAALSGVRIQMTDTRGLWETGRKLLGQRVSGRVQLTRPK